MCIFAVVLCLKSAPNGGGLAGISWITFIIFVMHMPESQYGEAWNMICSIGFSLTGGYYFSPVVINQ